MSDLVLWIFSGPAKACVVALVLCPSACSDAGEPAADAPLPSQSVGIEPLTEAELMGIPRSAVVLTVPWSRSPVSRDPASAAPRATLHSVEFSGGEGFDRATFELGADTPFPGYRIVWNEVATSVCGEETPPDLGPTPALLVQFKPSTAREESGRATVAQSSRSPGLPAIATARQLCDDQDHLVWALSAPDSTTFRIVELRRPPRLLVDLLHQEAESAPDPGSTTGG